jgi:hypothetical protein
VLHRDGVVPRRQPVLEVHRVRGRHPVPVQREGQPADAVGGHGGLLDVGVVV